MGVRLAHRYAKSLLSLSVEQKSEDAIAKDMQTFIETVDESRDFELLLESPVVKADKKLGVLDAVFGSKFNEISMKFMALIVKNGRENQLPAIAKSFVREYKEYKKVIEVELRSATKLDAATKKQILSKVSEMYEGDLEVSEEVDPSLIGGFVVRVNDRQIDASLSRRFTELRNTLLN